MMPLHALHAWILRPSPGGSKQVHNLTVTTSLMYSDTAYVSTHENVMLTRQGYWMNGKLYRYPKRNPLTVLGGEWAKAYDHGLNTEIGTVYTYATLPYQLTRVASDIIEVTDIGVLYHNGYRLCGSPLRSYPQRYAFLHTESGFERLPDYAGLDMSCVGEPNTYILTLYGSEMMVDHTDSVWYDDTYLGNATDLGLDL